ncbi:hypothetical protein GGR57DRAFT_521103 [Xylariaceae sp. FL1272]|nr:hypothetical protein GGR57DRAFT_521103 [Xylariaceae sp. FL1272]
MAHFLVIYRSGFTLYFNFQSRKSSSPRLAEYHRVAHNSYSMTETTFTSAPTTATTILQNHQTGACDVILDSSTTKTCWQTLPNELQQEIWRYALHAEPTILQLNAPKTNLVAYRNTTIGRVCHQSRSVQRRMYRHSSPVFSSINCHAWVNFDNTLLDLGSDAQNTVTRMHEAFRTRITKMHVETNSLGNAKTLARELRNICPELRSLFVSIPHKAHSRFGSWWLFHGDFKEFDYVPLAWMRRRSTIPPSFCFLHYLSFLSAFRDEVPFEELYEFSSSECLARLGI